MNILELDHRTVMTRSEIMIHLPSQINPMILNTSTGLATHRAAAAGTCMEASEWPWQPNPTQCRCSTPARIRFPVAPATAGRECGGASPICSTHHGTHRPRPGHQHTWTHPQGMQHRSWRHSGWCHVLAATSCIWRPGAPVARPGQPRGHGLSSVSRCLEWSSPPVPAPPCGPPGRRHRRRILTVGSTAWMPVPGLPLRRAGAVESSFPPAGSCRVSSCVPRPSPPRREGRVRLA